MLIRSSKATLAGRLRHLVQVQAATATSTKGAVAVAYATARSVYAHVKPLRVGEFSQAAQVQADATHRITMRHYEGLTPTHRIVWDSRTFSIVSVRNLEEQDRVMEVLAKEVL